ncbi:regulatory protein GemA, partial [Escherichia coli]|nr:regulatory protein GemA [Escherichia coli]
IEKLKKWQRRAAGVKHERPESVSK